MYTVYYLPDTYVSTLEFITTTTTNIISIIHHHHHHHHPLLKIDYSYL